MVRRTFSPSRLFDVANVVIMGGVALLCLLPFLHMLAVSLSAPAYVTAGRVTLWPVGFTTRYYQWAARNPQLHRAFFWAFARVLTGTGFGLLLAVLAAYPLSYNSRLFRAHNLVIALFLFALLFDAGILSKYIVVRKVGLYDTFGALVIPSAFNPWHTLLLMNAFRELPPELKEAAQVEGANHLVLLVRIYLPLTKPALVTVALFTGVMLWNEWFEPILYLRSAAMVPLQTYLRDIFMSGRRNADGLQGALSILAIVPVVALYSILQKYFEKGIVLGAVKQ